MVYFHKNITESLATEKVFQEAKGTAFSQARIKDHIPESNLIFQQSSTENADAFLFNYLQSD